MVATARLETRWIGDRPAGRPVLVFLHEGLGCMAQWRDFPDRVAAAVGLPALVYSRLGYGGSDPVALPRPVDYLNREGEIHLPALLDQAGIDQAILIGHSDGATIALVAAGSDGDRRVLGVVAMAPHSFVEDMCLQAIAAVTDIYRDTDLRQRLARYHGDNVDCAFWGWNSTWLEPAFKHWHIRSHLAAISVPVLVIQGEDDEYATLAQVDIIRDTVPAGAQCLVLPACGHTPQRDQAEAVLAAIVGFVSLVSPVSG
ncbi:alpha/beta fold hydrolase [Magnetospirillum sulfuroxidans]|nr:alpha/beta hydrolase [Magnetospirillum sulfuroxidans]